FLVFVVNFTPNRMQEDRKTPEMRAQMTDIERLRHSTAHVLATAILKIWPEAQFAAGPPVDNGFYYDVDLPHRISPEDFEKIEAEMKKEIKANHSFERMEVSRDEALELGKKGRLAALTDRGQPSKFKLDIIENIPADEKISLYRNGDFIDLCAGPHVMRTGNIGAFKLTSVASAYYKGDEKKPQLQRIYGTAFKTKKELDDYFAMLEEAKKRDHRKLGKELEIYILDDDVGPGLPMWLPRGAAIIEELEKLAKETEFAAGYVRVRTPHIARESLYKKSGHLPYYADSMFPPMELKYDPAEEHQAAGLEATIGKKMEQIKAFENIFTGLGMEEAAKDHRESLQRLEENKRELATLNSKRNEMLARSRYYLKAMNCPHHHKLFAAVPRSYRDLPLRLAEYGTDYRYEKSGELFGLMRVRSLQMNDAHIYCTPEQFEAEFNAVSATNQVDFSQPRNFDLRYKDRDNNDKIPICIHRAPLGTHERFIGFLIEHYAGNFPLWLAPEQVRILPIGDDTKVLDYSMSILNELRAHQVRAEIDKSSDNINGKIQRAEQMKVHTMFVIGKRDMEADAVSVRVHGKGNLGAKPRGEVIADIFASIKERRS